MCEKCPVDGDPMFAPVKSSKDMLNTSVEKASLSRFNPLKRLNPFASYPVLFEIYGEDGVEPVQEDRDDDVFCLHLAVVVVSISFVF
ncbi:unnamed protein product [Caenorhabditis auriculariae]|uniref:Uncharacterized protein n=1 Tax=Caenorhabditis auriculariae TaxID=2777116 RepID=A0A8S1GRM2_9PELO|nr:unnamed protein product [Caenorhabditis auriculariae]